MKCYLTEFFKRYEYPADASEKLLAAYDVLSKNADYCALVDRFYVDTELAAPAIETALDAVCEATGVHPYTAKFLYYICLSKELPSKYAEKGIPEDIMWESLEDFRYKLLECLDVHGIPGFFSTTWFHGFFRLRLFKLGRLEYVVGKYNGEDLVFGDVTVKGGDNVINIHIPSSGARFDKAARFDSYDRAYHFFREVMHEDVCAFMCSSWLLFPENRRILGEKSNIVSFLDDFRIIWSDEMKDNRIDMWRIFGKDAVLPIEQLPRDNSLKRGYADWLAAGHNPGRGKGLFVWDPISKTTIR